MMSKRIQKQQAMISFEKTLKIMRHPATLSVYLAVLILMFLFIDKPLAIYVHQWDLRAHFPFLNILTLLGEGSIYVILLSLLTMYFRYIKKDSLNERRTLFLFLCIVIASIVCSILKIVLGRARPELWFSIHAYGFYWFRINSLYWSLPSGHTTTVVSLASGLGVLFPKYFLAFFSLAGIIILTRIALYYHYLSDVLSAIYLSVLIVGILVHYAKKNSYLNRVINSN